MKKKKFLIGAYSPILTFDKEHVKLMAEAGINFPVSNFNVIPEEFQQEYLDTLYELGIEAAICSDKCVKIYMKAPMLDLEKQDRVTFLKHPAFGYYIYCDEPGMVHFDILGEEIAKFQKAFPGKYAYINLLPMYANARQLMKAPYGTEIKYFDEGEDMYQRYLDEFVEKVPTHHIGVDIYPARRRAKADCPEMFPAEYEPFTYGKYLRIIEIVADKCKESGREFWACIQTCAWEKGVREITTPELRWQAYTMLSFGATAIFYYVFASRKNHTGCMLNERGETTKLFYGSKKMCEGLQKLSDVYFDYKNVGAYAIGYDPEKTPYLYMKNPYDAEKFGVISDIETNTPLLVGCFEKTEGNGKAFTIVNQQDWSEPLDSVIKMKIDGKVTKYYDGEPEVMKSENGVYELHLAQGDGVFVTVE